jgi:hypothetical protein
MSPPPAALAGLTGVAGLAGLAGLAGALAVGLAIRLWRRGGPLSGEGLVRAVLLLLIAVGLLVPAVIGALRAASLVLEALAAPGGGAAWGYVAGAAVLLLLLALAARHGPRRLGERRFLLAALLLAAAVKLAWVLLVRAEPVSDFEILWRLTGRAAGQGLDAVAASLPGVAHVYLERILPFLLPLRLLFGPGALVYALANVAAQLATSWLVWHLARRWFGPAAAGAALLVSLAAPETLLAAGIPTHDIPGALYTLLALALLDRGVARLASPRTGARWGSAAWAGAGFGLLAVVVDLQRTTGPFLLLPCGLTAVAAVACAVPPGRRWRAALLAAALLLVLPYGLYRLADRALVAAGLAIPPEALTARRGMVLAAGSASWGDGGWDQLQNEYLVRYRGVELNWPRHAALRLASDLRFSPAARLSHYTRKSRLLFDLGTQTYFYLAGARRAGPLEPKPLDPVWVERSALLARCFTVPFLFGLVLGCLRLWRRPAQQLPPLAALLPLVHLATVSLLLLLFALVQPRYLYQVWAIGAIYLGQLLAGPERENGEKATVLDRASPDG